MTAVMFVLHVQEMQLEKLHQKILDQENQARNRASKDAKVNSFMVLFINYSFALRKKLS